MITVTLSRTKRCRRNFTMSTSTQRTCWIQSDRPRYVTENSTGRERLQVLTKRPQWKSGSGWGRQAIPLSRTEVKCYVNI